MFRFGDPGGRMYGTTANLTSLWTGNNGTLSQWGVIASNGRTTGSCLRGIGSGGGVLGYISKNLTSHSTWGMAFAYRTNNFVSGKRIISLYDSGVSQVDIRVTPSGNLYVTRADTTLAVMSGILPLNTWNHIELKTVINSSSGTIELRLNGQTVIGPLTGQNTQNSGSASANTVALGDVTNSSYPFNSTMDFDDIVVWDGQTTDPQGNPDISDFIGDCGLSWILPNGDGTTTQFTRDSGTNNYLRVNETTPDGDTSYVQDATIGHIDTYAMANLPAGATGVKSMAVVTYAEKTDVGSRAFCAELRTNSANFAGSISQSLGNSYQYYFNNWGQNPSGTPATWTVADINAIEAGQKVLS